MNEILASSNKSPSPGHMTTETSLSIFFIKSAILFTFCLMYLSSIFFVFSRWIYLFNDHKHSTFYKLLLYSTIVLASFQRKDTLFGINLYIIFICLFSLYYLSNFIKTKYSRVRGFIFHIVLSLFLLATNIATNSGEMFFAWTLVSFFVIFPYRFLRENNMLRLTIFSFAIHSILYITFIVFVFLLLLHL